MRGQLILFVFIATTPAWAQVTPSAVSNVPASQMMVPPPVSNINYPTTVGAEVHSNYLRGAVTESTAYISNLYADSGSTSIAETTITIMPSITFDTTTGKRHITAAYSPGFTFYRPSSALNEIDNTATVEGDFHLTPHTAVTASDSFQDSSTPFFNPAGLVSGGLISGSPQPATPGVIPPFAQLLSNVASVELTAQTGLNTMFGASGSMTLLLYPNSAETTGLYNSDSRAGSGFYNQRISDTQYVGAIYQYADMLAYPTGDTSTTRVQAVMGYYTLYARTKLSFSVLAGPQHYESTFPPYPAASGWGPSITASTGWQGMHTSVSASYSQSVTGGGGLLGGFHSRTANVATRWQISRYWTASAAGAYSIIQALTPQIQLFGIENGHSVSGSMTVEHTMGEHWRLRFDYFHLYQSYDNIAALSSNPNSDSGAVSIVWQFTRPLGN